MELSNIRYDQKDFKYTAVRLEIKKVQKIKPLYEFGKLFLPTLFSDNKNCRLAPEIIAAFTG